MSNNEGIVVYGKTLSLKIMLPEKGDLDFDEFKEEIKKELQIETGNLHIPMAYTKESRGNPDFGSYGRRWCIRVAIDASKEDALFEFLRHFCKDRGITLNENGADPFEGRHPLFGS